MTKLFEVALIDNTTVMINVDAIISVKELPQWMEIELVSGAKYNVIPQTLMSAFESEKVGYFKFQKQEAEEPARDVEGEVIPA